MENDVLYNRVMNVVHEEYGPPGEGTKEITITENGTTTEDVRSYASAEITAAVPNSYTESDEGKVVDSGALVSQSSATYTENDTYDTTLINSVTVNVSGGGGSEIVNAILGRTLTTFTSDYEGIVKQTSVLQNNTNLVEINMPNVTQFGQSASITGDSFVRNCTNLTNVYMPKLERIYGSYLFGGCTSLAEIVLPSLYYIYAQNVFRGDTNLGIFDCGNSSIVTANPFGLGQNIFYGCTKLNTIICRHGAVIPLQNINAFSDTPFASSGTGGTLYVPQALISSYQSDTNWSTILGYANNQIKSIESTHTDPEAPIDLTLYYADGTPIPTP